MSAQNACEGRTLQADSGIYGSVAGGYSEAVLVADACQNIRPIDEFVTPELPLRTESLAI